MTRYITYFCLTIAGICIGLLTNMAYTYYFTSGFGLHPVAAGAVILVLLGYMWVIVLYAEWFSASASDTVSSYEQPTLLDLSGISPFNPSIYLKD